LQQSLQDCVQLIVTEWFAEDGRILKCLRHSGPPISGNERERDFPPRQGSGQFVNRVTGKVYVQKGSVTDRPCNKGPGLVDRSGGTCNLATHIDQA